MAIMRILNFIFGYRIFVCPVKYAEDILNVFMKYRIIYWNMEKSEENISFRILSKDNKNVVALFLRAGIEICRNEAHGIPHILYRYRKRFGLMAGAAIFAVLVYVSGEYIWEINITGNYNVSEAEIKSELAKYGLAEGARKKGLDSDYIEHSLLIGTEKISWIKINFFGTSANVTVREIENPQAKKAKSSNPSNLVSTCDGQIERITVYEGQPVVNIGDSVLEGDLLVSGIIESKNAEARYTKASGEIFAKTVKQIHIEIPLEYEKKVYTGEVKKQKTLNFFAKSINLFINGGNFDSEYDKIEKEEYLTIFNLITLPVSIGTNEYREYRYETAKRSETEAVKLAYYELLLETQDLLRSAELLKKTVKADFRDEAYVIDCELYCIENIAKEIEIETE